MILEVLFLRKPSSTEMTKEVLLLQEEHVWGTMTKVRNSIKSPEVAVLTASQPSSWNSLREIVFSWRTKDLQCFVKRLL